jgi:hypothetical protein
MASFRLVSWGSLPLGALAGGVVGQAFGLPAVFIGAAVVHAALLPTRLILTDAFMAQVEAHAAANADVEALPPVPVGERPPPAAG